MPDPEAQIQNQIRNIETSTGRSMDDWVALVHASGFTKHGQIVSWLKTEHGMSHGNANRVALIALREPDAPEGDDLVEAIYSGSKAPLRPFHDRVSPRRPGSAATSSRPRSRPTSACAARSSSPRSGRPRVVGWRSA